MNKKGNVIDIIVIIIVLFLFAIISIFGMKTFDELNTDVQADFTHNNSKNVSSTLYNTYPDLLDNLFLMMFILFVIFAIISVFLLDTHPIFFILTVIVLMGLFVASILLSNVFTEVMQDATILAYSNQFTYTAWVIGHLLELTVGLGFIMLITMFIKMR